MASQRPRPNDRPTVGERIERARSAAAPRIEKATASAAPKVEKAAQAAGGFLGVLRDRAKEAARSFSEGYGSPDDDAAPPADKPPVVQPRPTARPGEPADERPRPRPRPQP